MFKTRVYFFLFGAKFTKLDLPWAKFFRVLKMSGYSYPQNYTQAYSNDTNQSAYISSYDDEKLPNTIHPWSLLIGFASGISFSLIVILFVIGGMWVSNCTRILRYKKKAANFRSDSNPLHEEELQTTSEYSNLIELSPGSGVLFY